jgi:23S rRNA (adenine2503-C2)-methyltransferase
MPVEKRWPLEELVAAVRDYAIATRDRVTIAYVALSGVNMTREHARDLAALFASVRIKVNLIDVNDPTGQFQPPSEEEVGQFRQELFQFHIPLVRRYAGGSDIGAACGTLAATREGGSLLEAPIEAGRGQEITEPHRLTVPTGYPRMDTEEG